MKDDINYLDFIGRVIRETPIKRREDTWNPNPPISGRALAERLFTSGMRREFDRPDGRLLLRVFTEALGRSPTNDERIRFQQLMRGYGWVDEHFHMHKVRYLESKNLSLRESNQALEDSNSEMRELLGKLRDKLIEQDEVIKRLVDILPKDRKC